MFIRKTNQINNDDGLKRFSGIYLEVLNQHGPQTKEHLQGN